MTTISDSRKESILKLMGKAWWNATSNELKIRIMFVGDALWDGFLADLSDRPDKVGDLVINKIVEILPAGFAVITKFEVVQGEKVYNYEYVSWNRGPKSGAKGLVLIANGDEITHFVVLRGPKFAPGFDVYDVVGGFAEVNETGLAAMLNRFKKELHEELGVPDLKIKEIRGLGRILPDAGMTNNHPDLFAAIIDATDATNIGNLPNPDPFEITAVGPVILPISDLGNFVMANDDGYFHILVTRCIKSGLLPASVLS